MRTAFLCVVLATLYSSFATTIHAQDSSDGWSGQATLYGWFPSMQGAQKGADGSPIVDLGQSSVLDLLQGAFFGTIEARKDKTGIALDLAYADLANNGSANGTFIPGANPASAEIGTKFLMATGFVSHRFYQADDQWVDAYGGLRYFDVDAKFHMSVPSLGFRAKRRASNSWVDAVVGLRGHMALSDRFGLTGLADMGGFGIGESSDLSWQIIGTLDYSFSENLIGRLGYRYLSIDKNSSRLSVDGDMFGPMIGLTWAF